MANPVNNVKLQAHVAHTQKPLGKRVVCKDFCTLKRSERPPAERAAGGTQRGADRPGERRRRRKAANQQESAAEQQGLQPGTQVHRAKIFLGGALHVKSQHPRRTTSEQRAGNRAPRRRELENPRPRQVQRAARITQELPERKLLKIAKPRGRGRTSSGGTESRGQRRAASRPERLSDSPWHARARLKGLSPC